MLPGPYELMEQIDSGCQQLDQLGRELAVAIRTHAEAEAGYQEAIQKAKLELLHDHRERGDRLPAEDLRTAMAHARLNQNGNSKLYATWLLQRANVDALRAHMRAVESSLSGRQSLLGALRTELAAQS